MRLDFLIQELHREANTLGSKSAALELTGVSVEMKVLIEQMPKRACLRYHMAACSGPCIGAISLEDYAEKVKKASSVLKGNIRELIESMEKEMRELASRQQFEQAMALRDEIAALEYLQ